MEVDNSQSEQPLKDFSKEQLIEMVAGFQEMLRSPTARDKFIRKASSLPDDRKARISASSVMPYYKPKYAKAIQSAVDKMLEDRKNRIFRYEDFPHITEKTLYQRVYQGFIYLVDNLDTVDYKYSQAKDDISIVQGKDGVRLELLSEEVLEDKSVIIDDTIAIMEATKPKEWRVKLQDFIEQSEPGQKLHIKHISLTEDELEDCHNMMAGIEEAFLYRFSSQEILIIHNEPEEDNTKAKNPSPEIPPAKTEVG